MKIFVKVKPGSKQEKVSREGDEFVVWVRERAVEGKANEAVRKILAKEFGVPLAKVVIKTFSGRKKIVEIATSK